MLIPELQEFHKLFSQLDILQQQMIKILSRDTPICEHVLGKWTHTPPGVEFWETKIRFCPARHKERSPTTKVWNCRAITLLNENEVFEKKYEICKIGGRSEAS